MARQGYSLSETEVRKIVHLLSETDLDVGAIAERMGCSKTAVMAVNRRFYVRDYGNHRNTWRVRLVIPPKRRRRLREPQTTS